MPVKKWNELPAFMKTREVWEYYKIISKKKGTLLAKRVFDVIVSAIILIIVSPVMLLLALMIKLDSRGPVFFRQERVTQYGRIFRIYKFRTMVNNAPNLGAQVTKAGDARITRVGEMLRKYRIDEIPQILNILMGDMTLVGTRPEVKKYVDGYSNEMYATLLLPAGVTSNASIEYKDEDKLLQNAHDVEEVYIKEVLPQKMRYNLRSLKNFSMASEAMTMIRTVFAVFR